MRNAQTFQRMEMPPLRVGNVPFADGNASFAGGERAFYGWKRLLCGWGTCILRMETPLRGRSGGHTGAAPTISRVAPCPKVAGEVLADGLKREKVAGKQFADGLNRKKVAGE